MTGPPTTDLPWPATVEATAYSFHNPAVGPILPFGSAIPASAIGVRSSEVGGIIYGLADQGILSSVNYPAISRDGGSTWAIDGPIFHIAAADGAAVVESITAISAMTAYACGGGNLIRWTADVGQHWWAAFFRDSVDRVSFGTGAAPGNSSRAQRPDLPSARLTLDHQTDSP